MTTPITGVSPLAPVTVGGHRGWCDAWAQDEAGLVLASFLGPVTVLQAIWGHLVAGHYVELEGETFLHRQHTVAYFEGEADKGEYKVRYHHTIVRFPQLEQGHLVMVAEPATLMVEPGQTGYLLAAQEDGDPGRFFALWNRLVPLPARQEWALYLWREGLRRECLRPIEAGGCHAWAIEPQTEPWVEIIRQGIESKVLR